MKVYICESCGASVFEDEEKCVLCGDDMFDDSGLSQEAAMVLYITRDWNINVREIFNVYTKAIVKDIVDEALRVFVKETLKKGVKTLIEED